MDYCQYKAEDFASEDYFKNWVNAPDSESDRFWGEFERLFPEKYYDLHEGRMLVESLSNVYASSAKTESSSYRIWERLEESVSGPTLFQFVRRFYPWLAAACMIIAMGFFAYRYQTDWKELSDKFLSTEHEGADYKNLGPDIQVVILPDGSEVTMDGGSRIGYRDRNGVREVVLHGGAFFKVVRQAGKIFEVKAGGVRTTVLGTSFRVKAFDKDQNIIVEVKTGKVRVSYDKDGPDRGEVIELVPNQKVVFSKESQSFRKDAVAPSILSEVESVSDHAIYIFDDAPVEKVFEAIESQYGVKIIYDKELMKDCRLKINFENESLNRKLDIVSLALGIAYEKKERKIVFEKKGCQ